MAKNAHNVRVFGTLCAVGPVGGSEFKFSCFSDFGFSGTKIISLSKDTALEPGKLYRLNIDFTLSLDVTPNKQPRGLCSGAVCCVLKRLFLGEEIVAPVFRQFEIKVAPAHRSGGFLLLSAGPDGQFDLGLHGISAERVGIGALSVLPPFVRLSVQSLAEKDKVKVPKPA